MTHRKMALEFRANQLEQITGRKVTGGVITSRGVRFRLAAAEAPDLAQLRDIFGRGVRARVGGGEISVEVGDHVGRVPLGQVIANRDLPRLTAVLGIDNTGAPVLLDLATSRHLLVADAENEGAAMLHTVALSLAMLNRQRDLQLLPIGKLPWEHWPHRLDVSLHKIAMLEPQHPGCRPALIVVIDNLDSLNAVEQRVVKTLLRIDAGVHVIASTTSAAAWPRFQTVARPTGESDVWQLTTGGDQLELQVATATQAETDAAINQLRAGRRSRVWTVQETLPVQRSIFRRLLGK